MMSESFLPLDQDDHQIPSTARAHLLQVYGWSFVGQDRLWAIDVAFARSIPLAPLIDAGRSCHFE
jgi:hypothetical protein